MRASELLRRLLRKVLILQVSHPLVALFCALALAVLSILYTVANLGFQTSQTALVSENNKHIRLLQQAERFSDLDAFVVAIENTNTARTLRFVRKLVPILESDREHYEQVFARVDPSQLRRWALLYLDEKELTQLGTNVREHADFLADIVQSPGLVAFFRQINNQMASTMVGELFTGFLSERTDGDENRQMDLGFLVQVLRQMKASADGASTYNSPWRSFFARDGWKDEAEEGYFWTENKKYLLVFVKPVLKGEGFSKSGAALAALRETIARTRAAFPEVRAGVTGQKALDEDEKQTALGDMGLATTLSLVGLAILLIVVWRSLRRPLIEMAVLVIALSITFGLTTLFIGHLNLLSVTFAPMLLGLGIDYGIHWFARYGEEHRRPGVSTRKALEVAMDCVGPSILLAGICASLSFFPLALTGFRGLVELGIICVIGLLVATLATLCLLPALIMLSERYKVAQRTSSPVRDVKPLMRITNRTGLIVVGLAALFSGLSVWGAARVKFDLNMLHLQSKNAESVIWENRLIDASRYSSIYGVLFARSTKDIETKTRALEKLSTVSQVITVLKILPADQERKIAILRQMEPALAGIKSIPVPNEPLDIQELEKILARIRFKMIDSIAGGGDLPRALEGQMKEVRTLIDALGKNFRSTDKTRLVNRLERFQRRMIGDLNDKLSLLIANMETRPMRISDVPAPLRNRFVGPDNLYLLRVFPKENIWEPKFLSAFVTDIQSVDSEATGDPVTLYIFTRAFRDACIEASIYAVVFILVFLIFALRNPIFILAALSPLIVGTLWTFGLMHLFKVDLNLANSIFMPLVVGAGVEYGVIVVQRWRQRKPHGGSWSLPSSTGIGVILAGLTTTLGFGSLTLSGHQGIHSLGLLSTIGSLSVLVASVFLLPALLHLITAFGSAISKRGEREGPSRFRLGRERKDEDDDSSCSVGGRNTGGTF